MTGYAMQISSAAIALIKKQQGLSWRNTVTKREYGLLVMVT